MLLKNGPNRLIHSDHIVDLNVNDTGDILFKLTSHVRNVEVVDQADKAEWLAWINANRFQFTPPAPVSAPEPTPEPVAAPTPEPVSAPEPTPEPVAEESAE